MRVGGSNGRRAQSLRGGGGGGGGGGLGALPLEHLLKLLSTVAPNLLAGNCMFEQWSERVMVSTVLNMHICFIQNHRLLGTPAPPPPRRICHEYLYKIDT